METFTNMFYTIDEAAELLRVHRNTIYSLVRSQKLEHYRVGNQIRITARELEKLRQPAEAGQEEKELQTARACMSEYLAFANSDALTDKKKAFFSGAASAINDYLCRINKGEAVQDITEAQWPADADDTPEKENAGLDFRTVDNAKRLASVLEQSADANTVQNLAELLRYIPSQLETDIHALAAVVQQIKKPEY